MRSSGARSLAKRTKKPRRPLHLPPRLSRAKITRIGISLLVVVAEAVAGVAEVQRVEVGVGAAEVVVSLVNTSKMAMILPPEQVQV